MPSIAESTDSAVRDRTLRQRHQRQRSALAMVIRAQQDQHVFQRHHDDQRPQDQRENAEHGLGSDGARGPAGGDDGFAQRVQRAGADVAIDDADTAEHQRLEAGGGMRFAMAVGRHRFRGGN
jgi:hypothetical protein